MAHIEVKGGGKRFGEREIFRGLDFSLSGRNRIALIGPSACGKTTLLRAILGLDPLDDGSVETGGARLSVCLQTESLLPWLTLLQNLRAVSDFPESALLEAIRGVGLGEFRDHYPLQVSGGMQQKLNLIRAFLPKPDFLLMDEPYVHLDHSQKLELCSLTLKEVERLKCGLLLVTHDIDEALLLSEEIWLVSRRPMTIRERIKSPLAGLGTLREVHGHPEYPVLFERVLAHLQREHSQ